MASRHDRLRRWMLMHSISIAALARQIGASNSSVLYWLKNETMPVRRHRELVALGFPPELLPRAADIRRGPHPVQPDFPGLREGAGA